MHWLQIILAVFAGLGVGSSFQGWLDRRHASAEARATRQFGTRLDAYRDASAYLERLRLWATLTEPIFSGPAADPPAIEPNEAWIELSGRVAVSASDDVRAAMRAVTKLFYEFNLAVDDYRASRAPGQKRDPTLRRKMDEARDSAIEAIAKAQTAMRDELANL